MKKIFDITDENLKIFEQIKKEQGFKTDVKTMNYIIQEFQKKKEEQLDENIIVEKIIDSFNLKNKNYLERLRWATMTAEKNSIYLLDIMNTILLSQNIDVCQPVEVYESPVITTSKEIYKSKLDYFKQMKEDRNKRKKY